MAEELASESLGASILAASSQDSRFNVNGLITKSGRKENAFWITTGCYPQELVLQLGGAASVSVIKTVTVNVRRLVVERCDKSIATTWEKLLDLELDDNDSNPQLESNPLSQSPGACFLKFKIMSGWGDFSTIQSLSVLGTPRDREDK